MQPAMMDSCWRVTYDSRWEADEFECFRRFMLRLAERRTTTRSPVDPSIWAAPLVPLLFVLCDANLPPADEGADNEPNTFTFGFAFVGLAVGAILSNNKKIRMVMDHRYINLHVFLWITFASKMMNYLLAERHLRSSNAI